MINFMFISLVTQDGIALVTSSKLAGWDEVYIFLKYWIATSAMVSFVSHQFPFSSRIPKIVLFLFLLNA